MSTQDIRNYRKVNDQLITGGMPTEDQLRAVAADGFQTVINLAPDEERSLPDEAGLVRSLGMTYHHIPVIWTNPQESDFAAFEKLMQETSGEKKLVHCFANFRVTAFYSLYAIKHLGWSEQQADEFRASVWSGSHYPIWESFLRNMKAKIANKT